MSREARWTQQLVCQACGRSFWAARSDARSCGPTCKKRLQRGSKGTGHGGFGPPPSSSQVVPFMGDRGKVKMS